MHRLIIVGSPRIDGKSAHLANEIFDACIEDFSEDSISMISVSTNCIKGCIGCDACREKVEVADILEDDIVTSCELIERSDAKSHICIYDDMVDIRKYLDAADELIIVSPVYFASAPSQFKALMDRLQPYYWSNVRQKAKVSDSFRPITLHIVGEGGDGFGYDPLIVSIQSAFKSVGFYLDKVLDWVGKIDKDGNILQEAEVLGNN